MRSSRFSIFWVFLLSMGLRAHAMQVAAPEGEPVILARLAPAETVPHPLKSASETVDPLMDVAVRVVRPAVSADVLVHPDESEAAGEGYERTFTMQMVETAAGTFGDPSRYVQTLAGVVADSDQRNDFLVRGGNPAENGFVIDNIETPSINQLALSDTTGGLVSMLDAAAVQSMTLHTDAYASRFDERISSIFEISTRPAGAVQPSTETEFGIAGMGGNATRRIAETNVFVSARASVMQYFTNNIGMDGVPVYKNAFVRADRQMGDRDSVWGMSLTGVDSIAIHPDPADPAETNPFDIGYHGWRNTTGVNWQHMFSERMLGVASLAQSEQSQTVADNAQLLVQPLVYNEQTSDAISTAKYDWTYAPEGRFSFSAGGKVSVDRLHYVVAQPQGLQNPYSESPEPWDSGSFAAQFATGASAGYAEVAVRLPHAVQVVSGFREEQWALGGHKASTGKLLLTKTVLGKPVHVGFTELAQMPETIYLLTQQNLRALKPIHSRQLTAGATLADNQRARVTLEVYQKLYGDYPVATEYPQLSMATIADTFGQPFLMMPLVGAGNGTARGAELTAEAHATSKLQLTATLTYARSWYAGLDGVLRKSNYDLPVVANLTGSWLLPHHLTLSWRYTLASGRPYTPVLLDLSTAQNRLIYDTTQINALRSNAYQRLDFRVTQEIKLGRGTMVWHAGLQNAMDNQNFYQQVWEPNWGTGSGVSQLAVQTQMQIFPDGDVKYRF
jgi:hypothetical protein